MRRRERELLLPTPEPARGVPCTAPSPALSARPRPRRALERASLARAMRSPPPRTACQLLFPLRASSPAMLTFGRRLPVLSVRPRVTSLALLAASRRTPQGPCAVCTHVRMPPASAPVHIPVQSGAAEAEPELGGLVGGAAGGGARAACAPPRPEPRAARAGVRGGEGRPPLSWRVDMFRLPLSFSRTVACSSSPSRGVPSSCRRQPRLGGVSTSSEIVHPAVLRPVFVHQRKSGLSARVARVAAACCARLPLPHFRRAAAASRPSPTSPTGSSIVEPAVRHPVFLRQRKSGPRARVALRGVACSRCAHTGLLGPIWYPVSPSSL